MGKLIEQIGVGVDKGGRGERIIEGYGRVCGLTTSADGTIVGP